jgi:hypothetical protein
MLRMTDRPVQYRMRARKRRKAFALVACLNVCLSLPVKAVDYNDFPPELQQILDERIDVLGAQGGICIAGRVTLSDAAPVAGGEDVQVNLHHGVDEPLWVYEGGGFIMGRTLSPFYAGADKGFILRAFGYDPIDAEITIFDGEMTYVEFEMVQTPTEELASVNGVVLDEDGNPFYGSRAAISFPFANHGYGPAGLSFPRMEMTTPENGEYSFPGLSHCEHAVIAWASGYAYHLGRFTPPVGGIAIEDRRLYPNRRIVIEYVYQTDGTRSFIEGAVENGNISWLNGTGGVDFSQGHVEGYDSNDLRDLELRQDRDVLEFDVFYANGSNGVYDAGAVDFDAVIEADAAGYTTRELPCLVGHVYVVRTYEESNYAKFLVKTDEASFRTVIPGDPDPIEFAGYGLTIDFTFSSDYSRVNVEKHSPGPPVLGSDALPYTLDISGMTGVAFSADLIVTYDEADVIDMRLVEEYLTLLRSPDNGLNWYELDVTANLENNALTTRGLTSFGWFAIADLSERQPADMDHDGDIDLEDVRYFQTCFTGSGSSQTDPSCVGALLDADSDVDQIDYVMFQGCMSAPYTPGDPACVD